ncbi:hypothetical protein [Phytomonospora endophytica]|uniref:Secreted protein n=1 Tax=Phytomonospora endophytica TaxID=714109 RepID=A0A841FIF6_9ACTN|nr:hypothetical protein [Phytomonospora endophytica]MBB6033352.1 hypothetical protein [Phytomonospora endophytica]GIG70875.1 hypothetical protein Pen01_71700 [Phytomonospora endophytica]
MRTFSKRVAAVALSAAITGAVFAPAIASAEDPPAADCAALTADLQAAVTALTTAVAVPVRDGADLPGLPVGGDPLAAALDVQGAVAALGGGGCLPGVPEPGADVTLCVELAVDLNLNVSAVLAAVVNVDGPDLTAAAAAAADLSTTVTALVGGSCLGGVAPPV